MCVCSGMPQPSWYIHSLGWRAARAAASLLQTHQPGNLGSQGLGESFQLPEHLKPRDVALGNPGLTTCLTFPTSALSPGSVLQTEPEDIPCQEFWGVQGYLHPPPKEPPFSWPPPPSSCN